MKLEKKKWTSVPLIEVCEVAKNIDVRKQSGTFNYVDIGSIDSKLKRISEIQEVDWSEASSRARQVIKKDDTLFSTVRVNLEKIAFVDSEIVNGIASTGFTVIRANEKANSTYLFYVTSSPKFVAKLVSLQKGTAYPAVSDKIVFNQKIPLPPYEDQLRIANLFQSIEHSIAKAVVQEKNLKALRKDLINKLKKEKPKFGKLIMSNCKTISVGAVAEEASERVDNPSKSAYERFVGLEEFETGELEIRKWISTEKLVSAMKLFKSGDVLFARRNVYLKRVSQVDFDGVCSGDAIVMRANQKIILPEFLTLVLNTNEFWDYALSNAAGAFSKRIKWRELAVYSFDLPDIKTQEKIVAVFNQLRDSLTLVSNQISTLKKLKQKLLNEILG